MSFTITYDKIVIPVEAKRAIAEEALAIIRRDTKNGLNARGESTKYDLRESGKLMNDVTITDDGDIVFNATYAEFVNKKIPFDGIAPQSMNEFEGKISAIVNQYVTTENQ